MDTTSRPADAQAPAGSGRAPSPTPAPAGPHYPGAYFAEHREDIMAPLAVPTGLSALDLALGGGLRPGSLIVLSGVTGSGRTNLALQMAVAGARYAKEYDFGPVLFLSYEMGAQEVGVRIVLQTADIKGSYTPPVGFAPADRPAVAAALDDLASLPLLINSVIESSVAELEASIAAMPRRPSLVVVDHLALIASPGTSDAAVRLAAAARDLKLMAMRLAVPVLLIAQLNRRLSTERGIPTLSDLGVASLEQDANVVLLIHRPSTAVRAIIDPASIGDDAVESDVEIIIAKSRQGPTGSLPLAFHVRQLRFDSVTREG